VRTDPQAPLRILQVAALGFPSDQGSQVYVEGMCRALVRRGHQVSLACYGHGLLEWSGDFPLHRTPRVPGYARLRAGPDLVKPWLDLCLAGVVARQEADILHAHNYEAPLSAVIGRRGRTIPLVYSAHTLMEQELPTYFGGSTSRRLAGWGGRVLDQSIPRLADHAIALSDDTAIRLRALGCRSVSVQPPGIDAEDLQLTEPHCSDGPWVIYAGNPDRYQELELLVEAMRSIRGAGLLLVGGSTFDSLELGGLERVRVVRETDFARVRGWLRSAAVAVLPRSECPGFPMKLLNYLGMALPVVAVKGAAPSLPGVVEVDARSSRALASAIQDLLCDPEGARQLGRRARAHILENWTWEARAVTLEALYRTILDHRGLGPVGREVPQYRGHGYAPSARTRHGPA
jgi:glycosyltransferase involved in cell wall biosynthesis